MKRILPLIMSMFLLTCSTFFFAQSPCNIDFDPTTAGTQTAAEAGENTAGVDDNTNFLTASPLTLTDTGGGGEINVQDGTEYCSGNNGQNTTLGFNEGPDLEVNIPVAAGKAFSCSDGVLTIILRGDYNNGCEVAFIVDENDSVIAQSEVTGFAEGSNNTSNGACGAQATLDVVIPACDLNALAADGTITFFIRTNGDAGGDDCCSASQVDNTCNDADQDGNCLGIESFVWPIVMPTVTCPDDITIECTESTEPTNTGEFAVTGCELTPTITFDDVVVAGDCPAESVITRTWTLSYCETDAYDETCVQMITVDDSTPPVLVCPENIAGLDCNTTALPEVTATATDNCSAPDVIIIEMVDDLGIDEIDPCLGGVITRTYTATDECGNVSEPCMVTFTFIPDEEPPVITCPEPADTALLCGEVPTPGVATATDNCTTFDTSIDGVPDMMPEDIDPCVGGVITYMFTAVDDCGLEAMCMQTFTYEADTEVPAITCPDPVMLTCTDPLPAGVTTIDAFVAAGGTAMDNCSDMADLTVSFVDDNTFDGCADVVVTRTYTIADACGNESTCDQIITVVGDANPPTGDCTLISDLILECTTNGEGINYATDINAWLTAQTTALEASFTDDCSTVTVTNDFTNPDLALSCGVLDGVVVTFTITDECDNATTCTASIILDDTTPPTINCPFPINVDCGDPVPAGATTVEDFGGIVFDGCPLATLTLTFEDAGTADICQASSVITRTYTATDDCGNTSTCEQIINIAGTTTPPLVNCTDNEIITCEADIAVGVPEFFTTCGQEGVVTTEGPTLASGTPNCPGAIYEIVYTVTDDCGRTDECTQTFTIANDPPTITCPEDEIVACVADIVIGEAITTFSCDLTGDVTTTGPTLMSGTADCPDAVYEVVYMIDDGCGRMASCTQTFTIANDEPTIQCPADAPVACAADIVVEASNATVTTSCALDNMVAISDPVVDGAPDCPGTTYTYTYTVTDDCGRTATCAQVFTIANDPPSIMCPADAPVACEADIVAATATAMTSCTLGETISNTAFTLVGGGTPNCPGTTYEIVYTVEDDCGRTDECTQTFTIANDPPTITCPEPMEVACVDDIVAGTASFTTSCGLGGEVTTSAPELTSGAGDTPGSTYSITYTVTDDCGRTADCAQVFTIANDEPTITCPADDEVACEADIVIGTPQTSVSCDFTAVVTTVGPTLTSGTADCPGATYEIEYTVTDDIDRTATCTQVLTIANDDPTITCPADDTVECAADIAAGTPVTTVSCGLGENVVIGDPVLATGDADCPDATYTITYTITDECNRMAECVQTFTIANPDPIIECPADDIVECEADIAAGVPVTTISCGLGENVVIGDPVLAAGTANCDGATYTILYTVTDDCNRVAECTQTFTISNAAPTIECPADEEVACAADIVIGTPAITTSCDSPDNLTTTGPTLMMGTADCPDAVYEVVYMIQDECGRTASCTQTFTIVNDEPTIICPADDPNIYPTEADIPPADITSPVLTSSCMLGTTVTWDGDVADTACPNVDNQGTVIRTYTVTDGCGRTASCTQIFLFSCCDALAGTLAPIDDVCIGESITTTVDGTETPAPDYGYDYLLTDVAGTIIAGPNTTGMFTPMAAGSYCVYGVSYQTATGAPDYTSGNINTINQAANCLATTNVCFAVTDPPTVTIGACAAGPAPTIVYEGLEGTYPDGQLDVLPDVYVFCEPGCVEATGETGVAPYMYEWFELSGECAYDFAAPIATTPDASGLGTGTYAVVVTDANGCTATGEVKVFIDDMATLTASDDATLCANETFDLEGASLPGPGFCLEYCGGALPQCPIDASSIITICMEFTHTYISDLSFELVAPDGTVIPLVMGQCCPNGSNDATMFCFTNDTSSGAVALDWNTTGSNNTDLLGTGAGISGTWLPEGGAGVLGGLAGVDANGGPWAMIVTDIIGGDSGQFESFNVTVTSPAGGCNTVFQSPVFGAAIPDNGQSFTYETPVEECVEQPNCTASYQWTGDDGFDSGVQTIATQTDQLETFPPLNVTPPAGTTIYTLMVTDCFGCVFTEEVVITTDEIIAEAVSTTCEELDITSITGGAADYTITIGLNPDASDALATATVTDATAAPEFTGLAAGDYFISIEDANGCSVIIGPITVEPCEVDCDDFMVDIAPCADLQPSVVYEDLEGLYPMDMLGILPDVYVFCEPGCVSGLAMGGTAPLDYQWFELSDECGYDFNAPIANTQEASGLGSGVYTIVVTDANGCTASQEVKVFVNTPPELTTSDDATVCTGETFDLEATSLPTAGFCLEYCEGELPVCLVDDNTIFTVCFDFQYTWISDLNLQLQAPNGTLLTLVSSEAYPNPDMDGNMCFTNDASLGGGVLPGGALDALNWNNYPGGFSADAAGLGIGVSGNWFPEGGQGAFSVFNGVDANSGVWQVIILDDLIGFEGFFNTFTLDIVNPDCSYNVEVDINQPIIDFVPTTIITEPIECEDQENCTASYQWTGTDGFDSGVIPIANQQNMLETLPPVSITGTNMNVTYTLTVTDCFGCVSTETVLISACDVPTCTELTPIMETQDLCSGNTPDLATAEANILASVVDAAQITGIVNWYTDAALTMPYTLGTVINHSDATCDPETTILFAEVVCNDGTIIPAGQIDITVYPFGLEVMAGTACVVTITPPACPGFAVGAASNPTGGASLANWDAATNTYTGVLGDAAGTIDIEITGGTAPCDAGTITIDIPACTDPTDCDNFMVDVAACTAEPAPTIVYEDLEGTYPDGQLGILPDVYVFCEPGCVEAFPVGGTAPLMYEWFELSGECSYDFAAPIANTPDASALGTGTYTVVVTDANGCTASQEVKVFIDEDATLTTSDDAEVCAGETFNLEGTALPGPGFCLEYCGGALPQCPVDADAVITVCLEFTHTFISDLSFDLVAPNGTIIPLVTGQCCPNGDEDATQFCFTNDTNSGAVALDWNTTGAANADLLGLGVGISGTWLPEGGAAVFNGLSGIDANGGPWAMIVTDIIGGDSGQFESFNVTITGTNCNTVFQSPVFGAEIPDTQEAFIYETPVLECVDQANCIASYQWTGTDGFDSGVIPITPQTDMLNTLPAVPVTIGVSATYTLTVTDCYGCTTTSQVVITECSVANQCTTLTPAMEVAEVCGGQTPDLSTAEAAILGSVVDPAVITGVVNWFTDAAYMMPYTGTAINHSGATCDPETTTLYAQVVCNDGIIIPAGQIDLTVYPFGPQVNPGTGCIVMLEAPACGGFTLGAASNATGGANAANWDAATMTYTGTLGDAAGTIDIAVTGGTAPCDAGTVTINIAECTDDGSADDCTALTPAMETIDICGGVVPDLSTIETNILNSVVDPTLVMSTVNWYTDAAQTTPYTTGTGVNHSNTTCDPETVVLYGEVVCNDGASIYAGTVAITVLPFGPTITPGTDCVLTLEPSTCSTFMIGAASNATGGVNLANWDAATSTYTGVVGDMAGTFDLEITGGTAPCDAATVTISIPNCPDPTACDNFAADIAACAGGPAPTNVYEGLEGTFPGNNTGTLPDIYVFCEPGCVSGAPVGGLAPYNYEWFELSEACAYDFNAPIATTQDISALGTGTYTVVITDANGCTATQEVKVFIDTPPVLTAADDAVVCAGETFDLTGTSQPGPGFCLDYCGGEAPQCIVDASSIIEICLNFQHTFISDLSFDLIAPDGTMVNLIGGVCCPINTDTPNDQFSFCFTNDTNAPVLDWNNGIAPTAGSVWQPVGGAAVLSGLIGLDANSGPWAMTITDIVGGDSGEFFDFNVTVTTPGGGCNTVFQSMTFNADIPDNDQPFTYETPVAECAEQMNCTASYQWTGTDGFDSGIIPIANPSDALETLPAVAITVGVTATYTLTVTDCFGCVSTETITITECNDTGGSGFDLALIKTLGVGQAATVAPGDNVSFDITVTNQGTVDAFNVLVNDYVPAGYTYDAILNPTWADADGDGNPDQTLAGPIAANGGTQTITIILTVNNPFVGSMSDLVNYAEISAADDDMDPNNTPPTDDDSTPDNDDTNDAGGTPNGPDDDYVDGDGTGTPNDGNDTTDEDDHDPAFVDVVDPNACTTLDLVMESIESCGGAAPDLAAIEAAIIASAGDITLITGDIEWYTDAGLTMPYTTGSAINHSDTDAVGTCDPGTVTLYAQALCVDGTAINGGTVTVTVYPFAEITPPAAGSCTTVVAASSCPTLTIGAASNATGGASLANWNAATNTYTGVLGDAAGTIDVAVTGGTAPCDAGTITINIPACTDDGTGSSGFDLALIKTLSPGQATVVGPGDNVSFDITVTNQGTVDAFDVLVNDYIPTGYTFDLGLNPTWVDADADGNPDQTIASLTAGGTQTITIILTVVNPFNGTAADLVNVAEISAADDDNDPNNTPPTDDDSTPDNDDTNDAGGTPGGPDDNFVDGNGTGTPDDNTPNTDEDDQDPAFVIVDDGLADDCTTLTAALESLTLCGGITPDLATIEATILGSVGDISLVTNAVNWYFDNTLTMPYTVGGAINHSDTDAVGTCDPGTVTLYGEVLCLDGASINAGTITVTVYPFAEVTPPAAGSCTTVVAASSCPTLTIGAASNATGGASLANWNAATNTYTGVLGDAAGTIDVAVTGGTAPCDAGTITITIPACTDDGGGDDLVGVADPCSCENGLITPDGQQLAAEVVTFFNGSGMYLITSVAGLVDANGDPLTVAAANALLGNGNILSAYVPADGVTTFTLTFVDANDDSLTGSVTGDPCPPCDGGDACTTTTEPTATAVVCGGLVPDLTNAEAAILAGIGDLSLITGDIIWYTESTLTTQYNGGAIDHGDSTAAGTCEAGIVTLYAQVICNDGERFSAGLVNITVYPFAPNIAPAGPGCMLVVTPACPGDIVGIASNATGGASLANWDPNTGVYTAFEGDFAGSIDLEITSANTPCGTMIYTLEIPMCGAPDEVPTVGEWGLIILGLLMSIIAVVGIRQRREDEYYAN